MLLHILCCHRSFLLPLVLLLASVFGSSVGFLEYISFSADSVARGLLQLLKGVQFVDDFVESTINEICDFSCPPGYSMVNNTDHTPSFNGCGSLGVEWSRESLPIVAMTDCCDSHDLCYDSCFADKDLCDLTFKRCLYTLCRDVPSDLVSRTACKATAKLLYTGTLALGCKSFRDAQRQACRCTKQAHTHTEL